MLEVLTLLSFAAVGYAYFGYPLVLWLLIRVDRGSKPVARAADRSALPSLTVVITVRNEAAVIRRKLDGTLALRYGDDTIEAQLGSPAGRVQLIVASDASDDGTDEIVREYPGVELVRLPERGGKERAQAAAVQAARGELIVFTDAKITLRDDVLERFATYFADPEVGAVSSVDRVETDEGASSGEGFYVRYEMWLRSLESRFQSLVGLSGSCFAVRRAVCEGMATDIPSDFALLLQARTLGLRGIHAPDVVASYKAVRSEREEFSRKVRTVLRGISTLWARREVLGWSRYGSFAWQIASHKLARWLVPWCMLFGAVGAFCLSGASWFWRIIALGVAMLPLLALIGVLFPSSQAKKAIKVPLFFLVSNAAVFVASVRFLLGQRAIHWTPSAKG